MAVQLNILPSLGSFGIADGYATAELGTAIEGTDWIESTYGTRYYLENAQSDGNATQDVLRGKVPSAYRGLVASPIVTVDTNKTGYISTENVIEPAIKWIFSAAVPTWYKVLSVINDNLIEVEKLYGADPITIQGVFTRGYTLKSVTVSAYGGAVDVYGYDGIFTIAATDTVTIPVNIAVNGPLFLTGDGAVTTNVPIYDSQWL
jgi:hypothetical protein